MILGTQFFWRPVLSVAPDLLGKFLVRAYRGKRIEGMITEVEAYDGPEDRACHASKGKTARTEVMFGPPGRWYVYLCRGTNWMLNAVTGPVGYPAAVLIRSLQPLDVRRPEVGERCSGVRTDGPGRLTRFLNVDKRLNGKVVAPKSGLWIEDREVVVPDRHITRRARVGVEYAGSWARKPYRFVFENKKATLRSLG